MKKIYTILLAIGAGAIAIVLHFSGSTERDKPKMIYSKPPEDIEGTVTVSVKEDTIPNNQTDLLELETSSLNELIGNPNVTINWKESGNKKKAEPAK